MDEEKFRSRMAGRVRFPEDMTSKKLIYAILIRSPFVSGLLQEIDVPELPENMDFFSAEDLPGKNIMPLPEGSIPLLAEDRILYKGQPVGILTSPDQDLLFQYSRRIQCRIRKTPPYPPPGIDDPGTRVAVKEVYKGDILKGLNKAEKVIEGTYCLEMPEVPSYPRMGIFCTKEGGRYILNLHTQWPSLVRKFCALSAKISPKQVELQFNTAGRSWDSHIWQSAIPAALAVAAASILRQPIKLMEYNVGETFIPRVLEIHYKAGIDSQGKLTALEGKFQLDGGAFGCFASEVLSRICISASGYYQCRNIRIKGEAYLSNTPPWLPMTGWGLPQGFFGLEMMANTLAEESGMDPASWRRKNLVCKGNLLSTAGSVKQTPPLKDMMEHLTKRSDFTRKHAAGKQLRDNTETLDLQPKSNSGIGMAVCFQGNEFLSQAKTLTAATTATTLDKEGNLNIRINGVPASPGLMALWRKRISAQMSIPEEQISFTMDLADEQTFTGPSTLSRSTTILTRLIDQSCDSVQKKRFREALPITETSTYRRRTRKEWDRDTLKGNPIAFPSWGAAVVDVELETATMELKVPRIWLSLDCGYIMDQKSARSYIEAEVRLALCQCLKKQSIRPTVFPELKIEFIDSENSSRRIGGLEGLVLGSVPAAFSQAVSLATGQKITSLPLTPGDLLTGGSYHAD